MDTLSVDPFLGSSLVSIALLRDSCIRRYISSFKRYKPYRIEREFLYPAKVAKGSPHGKRATSVPHLKKNYKYARIAILGEGDQHGTI